MIDTTPEEELRQYRRGRAAFLFVLLSYVGFALLALAIVAGFVFLDLYRMAVVGVWLLLFLALYDRIYRWHCPRCGHQYFFQPPFFAKPFKPCTYCGLSKWRHLKERDIEGFD